MIGAGFIGFIMLNAMYKRGWQLAVVEREPHVLPRMLDVAGAALVESWLAEKGVELHCGSTVQSISQGDGSTKVVTLDSGQTVEADVVVVVLIIPDLPRQYKIEIEHARNIVSNSTKDKINANIFISPWQQK